MTDPVLTVRDALARREAVSDAALDEVFPEELRERSVLQWTPVAIAMRAAELLAPAPGARVLDVGAGVGKVCLVGALMTEATWWGIEQDPVLVAAAKHAGVGARHREPHPVRARRRPAAGVGRVRRVLLLQPVHHADARAACQPVRALCRDPGRLRRVTQRLTNAREGTRVVTYYGFGGKLPPGYALISREPAGGDALELWIRDAPPAEPALRPVDVTLARSAVLNP